MFDLRDDEPTMEYRPLPRNAHTLYMLLRENEMCAEDIIAFFKLPPSRFLRMLRGRRLQKKLAMQEELARELVRQNRRSRMEDVGQRLMELTESRSSETARKVCMALLRGATRGRGSPKDADGDAAEQLAAGEAGVAGSKPDSANVGGSERLGLGSEAEDSENAQ